MTDAELLAMYAENQSEDALRALIEHHVGLVYTAALRQVRDPGMAQDVTQGVFMVLADRAAYLHLKTETLAGWLLTATRYGARNLLRSKATRMRHEREATIMKTASTSAMDSEKLFFLLDEALNRLSMLDRTAVALYYFENQSMRDVGNVLAVSESAAQMRVSRALLRLRKILERAGIACPADALEESLHRNSAFVPSAALLAAVANGVLHTSTAASGGSVIAKGILKSLLIKKVAALTLTAAVAVVVVAIPTVPLAYRVLADAPQVTTVPPVNTKGVANASANPVVSPFTATLPNGISVELLGASEEPLPQNFWAPDGQVIQNLPQIWSGEPITGMFPAGAVSPKQRGLIWSARFEFPPTQDIGFEGHLIPIDLNMGYGDSAGLYSEVVVVPKDQATGTIHFDFAISPWQTMATISGNQTVTYHQAAFGDFVFNPATNDGNDLVVTLLTNIHGKFQTRFVAVDKNGMPMTANETSSQATTGHMNEITARFNGVSLDQIQLIRYEVRPYDLFVEFQNVSLYPGKHTNVRIEYGNNIN